WTSHFLSCQWLLKVENAMWTLVLDSHHTLIESVGDKAELQEKATEIVDLISEPSFWRDLAMYIPLLEKHLCPLAITTNATQANNACLDIILLTLGHLFHIFSDPEYNMAIHDTIYKSLEKRWKQADQEVFILAVLFN
ncbi:hypothetical protein C8Q72DRAFT_755188, partial [Fomitopsis betulina]